MEQTAEKIIEHETQPYVNSTYIDFENNIRLKIKDPLKCNEAIKNVYSEFTIDFNDEKNKKYTEVISTCIGNGFALKKGNGCILISSDPARLESTSTTLTMIQNPEAYKIEARKYLPKKMDVDTWLDEAKIAFLKNNITNKEFFDKYWMGLKLYNYATLGLSFAKQDHQIVIMSRGNEQLVYLQLEGIKLLMSKGGCEGLTYDVIYKDEEFKLKRTTGGDDFEHTQGERICTDVTFENIKGAYAFCTLKGRNFVEHMTSDDLKKCYEASTTASKVKVYNGYKKAIREEIKKEGKLTSEEDIAIELKRRMDASGHTEIKEPWSKFFCEMIKKTVIRRLFKRVNQFLSPKVRKEAQDIIEMDDSISYSF